MNLEAVGSKTRLLADQKAFSDNGAAKDPDWLREIRSAAIKQFGSRGFPTSREERWRFTSLKRLAEAEFSLAGTQATPEVGEADLDPYLLSAGADQRMVFVNGQYAADLSSLSGIPADVLVGTLSGCAESKPELVQRHLAKYAQWEKSPFAALNTAFIGNGAFVYVPRDIILAEPIQLLFLNTPTKELVVSHPRSLLVVERGASAVVVEKHIGLSRGEYWSNSLTESVVGDGGHLSVYRVQRESESAHHTATTHSHQMRESRYELTTVELGGALSRHDINAVLAGEGAECKLYGLTQLRGRQHVDHHTTVDHAKPNCNSWELFNGIYDEQSRGVFTGRIVVRPGAQKTDSKQTNNNLLLSDAARADSQPQLEIYADDVKCTHGATLGPIDEEALFYFQSRGIEAEAARNLITYGFGVEILNQIGIPELREALDDVVHARLDEGAERRRAR